MTDTLRNMPRYIRNTDAFGWQGADSPDGPWRAITPPQSGTPWQTTNPMDDLRQASADVTGVEVLSPAAQAVWDAAWQLSPVNCKSHEDRRRQQIAAALRAVIDQVVPEPSDAAKALFSLATVQILYVIRDDFHAIATELEGHV